MSSPGTAGHDAISCPNCGAPASGAYCVECGQAQDVDPKSLRVWIRDLLEETLALDGRLWSTAKALIFRPGRLSLEWEAGRRARWTHPLRLYLIASFAFLALTFLSPDSESVRVTTSASPGSASEVASQLQEDLLTEALRQNYAYMMFVLVPLFAVWMKLLYRGARIYYVGHLVHALHIHAAFFLLIGFSLLFEALPTPWDFVVQGPFLVWMLLYPLVSAKVAYAVSWIGAALRTAVILPAHLVTLGAGFLVVAFATGTFDPAAVVDEAHDAYWEARDAVARGDTAAARARLDDVVSMYGRLERVRLDGHVEAHFASALLYAGNPDGARVEAERALVTRPDYLLALGVAAEASEEISDTAAANGFWTRYLEAYPPADSVEEYHGRHRTDLIQDADRARAWLAARAGEGPSGG